MGKKFWISFLAVYVAMNLLNFLIHAVLLAATYQSEAVASVMRPEQDQMMWVHFVTALVFSFFFTLIFSKGYEGKGMIEGVRYGFYVGLMVAVPMAYDSFAVYPVPYSLAIQWFFYGLVQYILLGVVAAAAFGKKQ
jgi:uncharacterized membrane protein YagU involved in acid resistance